MKIIIYDKQYYFKYNLQDLDINDDFFIGEFESLEDYMREENIKDFNYQELSNKDISEKVGTYGVLVRYIIYNSKKFKSHLKKKLRSLKIKDINDKKNKS